MSSVRSLAPLQQGQGACSRVAKAAGWRWEIRTLAFLSFPCPLLCVSPATLALLTPTRPGRLRIRLPGVESAWEGARWPSAAPVGRVAERALPVAPGWGRCLGRGPAGFGVLPSSKDAPKPLSISRCVNMANLFYSFSVHYTQLYIYIYTYISLYIDIYRYTHIYYL